VDALTKLISTIEIAIRYLLTGAVISAATVLSTAEYRYFISWGTENELIAAVAITTVGFIAFTFYRLVLWVIGDAIAWKRGWSVPSLLHTNGRTYDKPYAFFLEWRHSGAINDSLSGYLAFRWAVAHFASISGIALLAASLSNQEASYLSSHAISIGIFGFICTTLGLWQCAFLYRVERNLCSNMPTPNSNRNHT
jgi:hypothetical protein